MRDITEEAELKEKVKELTNDIGKFLHTYTHALITIQHSITPVIDLLGPDPFDKTKVLHAEQAVTVLQDPTHRLSESLDKLLGGKKTEHISGALSKEGWDRLVHLQKRLLDPEAKNTWIEFWPPALREIALAVLEIANRIGQRRLPRDLVRTIKAEAFDLARLCNLIGLHRFASPGAAHCIG